MTEPTYRPGDIAMVSDKFHPEAPAVYMGTSYSPHLTLWHWIGYGHTYAPTEVGPVLGNVADIAARLAPGARTDRRPPITCPVCGRTSHHPEDAAYGWCGACLAYTTPATEG